MSNPSKVTRADVVAFALTWNGWGNGSGYPGKSPNPACAFMGHGLEYSCADGVSFAFGKVGAPLIPMQPGFKTGYSYCPDGLAVAHREGAVIGSWQAKPADILFINTGGGAQPGHTELVTARKGDWVYSIGWDSGPSNVDGFTGQGGVHRHKWFCPRGVGNAAIMAAADAAKLSPLLGKAPKAAKGGHVSQHKTEHSHVGGPDSTPPPSTAKPHRLGLVMRGCLSHVARLQDRKHSVDYPADRKSLTVARDAIRHAQQIKEKP